MKTLTRWGKYISIANIIMGLLVILMPGYVMAQDTIHIQTALTANTSSGNFAPHFISALNDGKITQKSTCMIDVTAIRNLKTNQRYDIAYGAEVIAGLASKTTYQKWDESLQKWSSNPQGPANLWIQQLYVEAKHRTVYVMGGLKHQRSKLIHTDLSSGDLIESGNARPVPQLRAGFYDFVDVPFTQGWIQINGAVAYGMMPDDKYMTHHYNYYSYHIGKNSLYNYKFCYFRSNPRQRLSVTAGMQVGSMFGGYSKYYSQGHFVKENHYETDFKTLVNMTFPMFKTTEGFFDGSTIGTWDFNACYKFRNESEIQAYFQWPFEDGSGIGRRNKWDGLWGLYYKGCPNSLITGILIEYIDFRDQSGPLHYAPDDIQGPTLTDEATGSDNYYNNSYYNSYANYGMAMGTSFLKSPIYNTDGYPAFESNRANGLHFGIEGVIMPCLSYKVLMGYQRGLGTYNVPYRTVRTNKSALLQCGYTFSERLNMEVKLALDHGNLRGNNFGGLMTLKYHINTQYR